jgi:UDP-N-acetylglucosamine 1-carboxyvinyltransferase
MKPMIIDANCTRIRGGKLLSGAVAISGSKNTCLPLLAATLLTKETCILHNIPHLTDIMCMVELMRHLGGEVHQIDAHTLSCTAKDLTTSADKSLVKRFRASIYFLGALLSRKHQASVSIPGGCKLGERPIDIHLRAFQALGATVNQIGDDVNLQADQLRGHTLFLKGPRGTTVTGTLNAVLAAVLAEGQSILLGAAKEPEVVHFCLFLRKMGAKINGIGTERLTIEGVPMLHGADFFVPPDRIEAGTFIILGLLCCDILRLKAVSPDVLWGFSEAIPNIENYCWWDRDDLIVRRAKRLAPFDINTKPHPGFPTDLQPQITVLASQIKGMSRLCDTIFPERFAHINDFRKAGMDIATIGNGTITITGKSRLKGTEMVATDLRAGAAMYLAGLIAKGETIISRVDHIDRGYEHLEAKLQLLGASIERISSSQPNTENKTIIFHEDYTQKKTSETVHVSSQYNL